MHYDKNSCISGLLFYLHYVKLVPITEDAVLIKSIRRIADSTETINVSDLLKKSASTSLGNEDQEFRR